MRYYEMHEKKYRRLQARGMTSWDEWVGEAKDFQSFRMQEFAAFACERSQLTPSTSHVLEVGCGTGPLCCYLAARGFQTAGIDISPTAIEMARSQAALRNLPITYWVGDVCRDCPVSGPFDVIIDAHFLHCIVFDSERRNALANIRSRLATSGEYWLETSIGDAEIATPYPFRLDSDGVLWVATEAQGEIDSAVRMEGIWFMPVRRYIPSANQVRTELASAGLSILWERHRAPDRSGLPALFQVICRTA